MEPAFDSRRAEENGIILVNMGNETYMVVAITGTTLQGKNSAWRGIPKLTGTLAQCIAEIKKITNVG